jgi:hypothetical protein
MSTLCGAHARPGPQQEPHSPPRPASIYPCGGAEGLPRGQAKESPLPQCNVALPMPRLRQLCSYQITRTLVHVLPLTHGVHSMYDILLQRQTVQHSL